ncbi:hypothetical protein L7F22_047968 [Adiantum nelumboides]|nr:hypothetical protein [Adiantum nelumboides]
MALPHQFSASSQPSPTLSKRRGAACPAALRVSAFQACPDATVWPDNRANTTSPTLYQVLQIPPTASTAEIKASYRRLARLYHPDAAAHNSTFLFLRLHSAYTTLSDAASRAQYDLHLAAQAPRARMARSLVPAPLSATFSHSSTPRSASPSGFSPRIGRNWETDQCWC